MSQNVEGGNALKFIIDSVPIAIVYIDVHERYRFFSRYYETNHRRSVNLGQTLLEVLGEIQYRQIKPHIDRALAGERVSFETKNFRSDHRVQYLAAMLIPDTDEAGRVRGFLSISEDITERKLTELELKRSQESLMFALESARMGTWEIDLTSDRVYCSPSMLRLWGIDPTSFHGDRDVLQSKVHVADVAPMREAIRSAIRSRSIYELEYRIYPNPDEERWVNSRGRCTYDAETGHASRFSGVVYDVTEQRRSRDLAEKAVKARDNMISISAHELLTPISGTKLHLQTLKKKLEKGEDLARDALLKIASQTDHSLNRLNKLVNDMLDISRINLGKLTLKRERVNLSALIADTVDHSAPAMDTAGCTAKMHIEAGIEACVDPYRIEQVLSNLISNACRYAYGKPVEISLVKDHDIARLIVVDHGIGIKEEDRDRIFERFERATTLNEKAGLGLGLFLVKQIVEAHGGNVYVESEICKGSKFTVELPLEVNPNAKKV